MTPKYPDVKVKLTGADGNAFSIIGRVSAALKKARAPRDDIAAFSAEAMSGDYNQLLATCVRWVNVV